MALEEYPKLKNLGSAIESIKKCLSESSSFRVRSCFKSQLRINCFCGGGLSCFWVGLLAVLFSWTGPALRAAQSSVPELRAHTFEDLMSSQAYRKDNQSVDLTSAEAVSVRLRANLRQETTGAAAFSSYHQLVPNPMIDTDGRYDTGLGVKRNYLETLKGRPDKVCGLSGALTARVSDCTTQNGGKAHWSGLAYGQGGEGDWRLVTAYKASALSGDACSGACYEVWRDERTRLLWSDKMAATYNWFQAAGYSSSSSTVTVTGSEGGADRGTSCNGAPCQPATSVSVCADAALLSNLNGVSTYSTPAGEDSSKGNLTYAGTPSLAGTPNFKWRLPTIEDWELANVNGIRKVLKNMDYCFWSASSNSNAVGSAWNFCGDGGNVGSNGRDYAGSVRCVGR